MMSSSTSLPHRPSHNKSPALDAIASRSLLDLMSDGFYMLLLVRGGQKPTEHKPFEHEVLQFLSWVERTALSEGIGAADIHAARYAFCAAMDEVILAATDCSIRDSWQLNPLQLTLFGDQLAGDRFFVRLDELRSQGAAHLPALEVYYLCLLLGFQGKYRIESPEKLGYLTARLGDELTLLKGKRTSLAPHWAAPDRVAHTLRRHIPLWAPSLVLGVIGLLSFVTLRATLSAETQQQMTGYHNLIQIPARTANLTITLP